jgi:hypothetical protein
LATTSAAKAKLLPHINSVPILTAFHSGLMPPAKAPPLPSKDNQRTLLLLCSDRFFCELLVIFLTLYNTCLARAVPKHKII